jgi:hypothetical protein
MDLTGATWRKSSHSTNNGGNCVELARADGIIGVRDSKNPQGGTLRFTPRTVRAFLDTIKRH